MAKKIRQKDLTTWEVTEAIVSNESIVYSYNGDDITYTVYDIEPKVNQYAEDVLSALVDAAKNDKDFATRFLEFINYVQKVDGDVIER